MEKLTIYLDRMSAGGEIRDSQNVVVYRLERAYKPLTAQRGPDIPGGRQEEGLTGLGRKLGGWAQGVARNRAIVRDVLSNTGFVLETATVVTRGDLDDEHLKKIYKVKKAGPFAAYTHIDQGGLPSGAVPVKVTALDGKLMAWGRCPSGQWVKRRYLLQSPDGETLMETKRESWWKPVFSIHRSATGEQIGWLRQLWYWSLIPNAPLIIFFLLPFLVVVPLAILVSPAVAFVAVPLLLVGLGVMAFRRPFLAGRFGGGHRYELEFWGEGRERLRTVALSLCIGRMSAGTRGGRR